MAGALIFEMPDRMKMALSKMRPSNEALLLKVFEEASGAVEAIAAWDMTVDPF